jgi:hypothetical protein
VEAVPYLRYDSRLQTIKQMWDLPKELIPFVEPAPVFVPHFTCPPVIYTSDMPKRKRIKQNLKRTAPSPRASDNEVVEDSEQKVVQMTEDSDDSVAEWVVEGQAIKKYGGDFKKHCIVGHYAVIECKYQGVPPQPKRIPGIGVVQVIGERSWVGEEHNGGSTTPSSWCVVR